MTPPVGVLDVRVRAERLPSDGALLQRPGAGVPAAGPRPLLPREAVGHQSVPALAAISGLISGSASTRPKDRCAPFFLDVGCIFAETRLMWLDFLILTLSPRNNRFVLPLTR